jgi:hypothetical protein
MGTAARKGGPPETLCPACRRSTTNFRPASSRSTAPLGLSRLRNSSSWLATKSKQKRASTHSTASSVSARMRKASSSTRQTFICRAGSAKLPSAPFAAPSMSISTKAVISCASTGHPKVAEWASNHRKERSRPQPPRDRIVLYASSAGGVFGGNAQRPAFLLRSDNAPICTMPVSSRRSKSPSVAVPTSCLLRLWDSKQRGIGRSPCQLIWLNAKRNSSASTSNKTSVEEQRCSRWML